MGLATYSYNRSTSGGEIIRELVNASDGQGLHFDGAAGNIDIASPPDLGAFAVYINNGAGYPTTTTAMTVDALSAEIPAGTVLTFREGGEYIVTTTAAAAATSIVSTSGLTGAAVVDNEGAAYGGANKFSFELIIQADEWGSTNPYIIDFYTGGRLIFGTTSSQSYNLAIYDNSGSWDNFGVKVLDDLKVHHLCVTVDGTSAILYDNGNQVGTQTISASHGIDNCSDLRIGQNPFNGTIYRARFWNKTLSSAEVTATYENATVPFADQYGSQTALVTGDDSDMDTVGNWTTFGGYTVTGGYDSGDVGHDKTLRIEATDANGGARLPSRSLTRGKRYKITFDYKSVEDTGLTHSQVALYDNLGNWHYFDNITLSATWASYSAESIYPYVTTSSGQIYLFVDDGSGHADNELLIDNLTMTEIGCVADYDLAFAQPEISTMVQDRAGAADGTSSATGVTQVTPIEQLNSKSARIGTSAATPADGDLDVSGTANVGGISTTSDSGIGRVPQALNRLTIRAATSNNTKNALLVEDSAGGAIAAFRADKLTNLYGDLAVTGAVTATGNVGVGAAPTSPSSLARYLYVGDTSSAGIVLDDTNSTPWEIYNIQGSLYFAPNGGTAEVTVSAAGLATFSSGIAVTTGDVKIGTTSSLDVDTGTRLSNTQLRQSTSGTAAHDFHDFYRGTEGSLVRVGNIRTTGTATAYNTSSDYRLKENVTELTGALDRLDSIPVYNFNFKTDPTKTVDGFLAHEVAEFVPEAISGTKDEMQTVVVTEAVEAVEAVEATYYAEGDELPDGVAIGDEKTPAVEAVDAVAEVMEEQPKYQGIDQSKLVPLMLAAIKELKAKVTALENA